ncbi:MAG: tetratricopeptide repeat protein [Spirochaetaceae bacterium]|nr:tetratricopeptide repeat protein [Spirochaetaceae bacterium]
MVTAEKLKALEFFSEGRKLYKMMDFQKASDFFQKAIDICPDDEPSSISGKMYILYK